MSSNTGLGLQSLFPDNLFRGIHELITKNNGLDFMIHRGSHNIPYGFMGLVTLTAGAFTYVTYQDYATEVSNDLSKALQSSELFIPAEQDSLKDSTEEDNNNEGAMVANEGDEIPLENAVSNDDNTENTQSIESEKDSEKLLEKETPKQSDQRDIDQREIEQEDSNDPKIVPKRDGQQNKENRKTEISPKVRSETDEQTKSNGGSKKSRSPKKTIKHRKTKK